MEEHEPKKKLPSITEIDQIFEKAAKTLQGTNALKGVFFSTMQLSTMGQLLRSPSSPYKSFIDIVYDRNDGLPPFAIFKDENERKKFQEEHGLVDQDFFNPSHHHHPEKEPITLILQPKLTDQQITDFAQCFTAQKFIFRHEKEESYLSFSAVPFALLACRKNAFIFEDNSVVSFKWAKKVICFKCGFPGHIAKQCSLEDEEIKQLNSFVTQNLIPPPRIHEDPNLDKPKRSYLQAAQTSSTRKPQTSYTYLPKQARRKNSSNITVTLKKRETEATKVPPSSQAQASSNTSNSAEQFLNDFKLTASHEDPPAASSTSLKSASQTQTDFPPPGYQSKDRIIAFQKTGQSNDSQHGNDKSKTDQNSKKEPNGSKVTPPKQTSPTQTNKSPESNQSSEKNDAVKQPISATEAKQGSTKTDKPAVQKVQTSSTNDSTTSDFESPPASPSSTGSNADIYDVEKVLDYDTKTKLFKIKWVNYPSKESTWEPYEHLRGRCDEAVRAFLMSTKCTASVRNLFPEITLSKKK
jgi:hypothetical protein